MGKNIVRTVYDDSVKVIFSFTCFINHGLEFGLMGGWVVWSIFAGLHCEMRGCTGSRGPGW